MGFSADSCVSAFAQWLLLGHCQDKPLLLCHLQVVRSRNSASIYRPTCIANLVNAALWVAYGIVSVMTR